MKLPGANSVLKMKLEVAALIDVVFLLLIYFMVTSSLIRSEADLAFVLPLGDQTPQIDIPLEVLIEIKADGVVQVEGMRFSRNDASLDELAKQVAGLKRVAAAQGSEFFVNLLPDQDAKHGRIIDVMDACNKAGVEKLAFSKSI
jgi:biopolymer transport protein ExbD